MIICPNSCLAMLSQLHTHRLSMQVGVKNKTFSQHFSVTNMFTANWSFNIDLRSQDVVEFCGQRGETWACGLGPT